ncbi:MAG: ABC transporter permease [Candidatus Glassbacteria bacterium]|nr:ABC transporter permease [Candidatus Glassbacteria bacterium]
MAKPGAAIKDGIGKTFASPGARALASLAAVVLLGVIFNADGAFFKWGTHRDMLRQVSVFGILGCGMTVVIIAAGIDLSVGSLLGMTAVLFSMLSIRAGVSPLLAIPVTLAAGAVFGAASGMLSACWLIQPFIATLAMMVFARGVAKMISAGQKISTAVQQADGTYEYMEVPAVFEFINSSVLGGNITVVTLLFLLCVLVTWLILDRIRLGRWIYAIGGNEEAARLSGVPVRAVKVFAYALSGMYCGLAGICQAAQEQQGDPEAGMTYELTAIAIVVIGGTSLRGGTGSIWLTLLGTVIIGYLEKVLSINAVGEASRLMLTGAIIILAVLFQKRNGR